MYKRQGYNTPAETAKVEPVAADNAAVTVLPAHDDKVLIIIESEDHKTRSTFTVNLGAPETMDPADDSRDYPVDKIVNTETGSVHEPASGNEGPLSLSLIHISSSIRSSRPMRVRTLSARFPT